ncbi:hypothetical protein JQ604_18430 [Bradyrhizobium jicamae]|uniref:hypothetical protein n=1 Tax=Bradyrhizobium jicamae TaxID=280332 RepID=UPI001BADA561|nr:hypothetical protein [Bradyrhizobium jicamae]MBR0754166.1 hypothetical protein [Bradyrhizobium jicamae]
MKRLILTSLSGSCLRRFGLAEAVIQFGFRFIAQPLPPAIRLEAFLDARSDQGPGWHWTDWNPKVGSPRPVRSRHIAFTEYCARYDLIELWFDSTVEDQLQLIWLLDFFESHPETAAKLKLRLIGFDLIMLERAPDLKHVPLADISPQELRTASMCWQAYRATTPEACIAVLKQNLSAFPLLRPALLDLIQELPSRITGLGATEIRLLELIGAGFVSTNALFYLRGFRQRGVFSDMEIGTLLEGLAHGPRPAITGLDDELRTIDRANLRARLEAYQRSRLSLTDFGKEVLAHKQDFSRHNPIDRWWGGTHLTNDNMWRWNPTLMKP